MYVLYFHPDGFDFYNIPSILRVCDSRIKTFEKIPYKYRLTLMAELVQI